MDMYFQDLGKDDEFYSSQRYNSEEHTCF